MTDTLRALAIETADEIADLQIDHGLIRPWDSCVGLVEVALRKAQALQREADAQIAETCKPVHGEGLRAEVLRLPTQHEIIAAIRQGASERPRAATSDGHSGTQAEPSDHVRYAHRHLTIALKKSEDAPASAAQHEIQAWLALHLQRVPTTQEALSGWKTFEAHAQLVQEMETLKRENAELRERLKAWQSGGPIHRGSYPQGFKDDGF